MDKNGRYLSNEDYSSFQEAKDNSDKLSTYVETVEIVSEECAITMLDIEDAIINYKRGHISIEDLIGAIKAHILYAPQAGHFSADGKAPSISKSLKEAGLNIGPIEYKKLMKGLYPQRRSKNDHS